VASFVLTETMKPGAELQGSLVESLANVVLANWEEWKLGGSRPSKLGWILYSRGHVQKSVIKFINPSSARPVAVAKLPNTPGTAVLVQNEHNNIQDMREELRFCPDILGSLPRPLALIKKDWAYILVEEAFDGQPVTSLLQRADERQNSDEGLVTLGRCFRWLVDFHHAVDTPTTMRQHGDFAVNNLFLLPGGRLAVIDWENFGKYPPCFDLFSLVFSAGFYASEADDRDRGPQSLVTRFEAAYFAPTKLCRLVSAFLASYCQQFNMDKAGASEWLDEFLTLKRQRMEDIYGTRNIYALGYLALGNRCYLQRPLFIEGLS